MAEREVRSALALAAAPLSLDVSPEPARAAVANQDAAAEYELVVLRQGVARALNLLDARERAVIERPFGFGCEPQSLQEIGDYIGLTHERIRQIQNVALDRLRGLLAVG
jgi:RNA polymerase nonessential primary-like sigma factor